MFAKPSLIAAGLAVALATLASGSAEAHRRWLLPSATVLAGENQVVTVDAAASNALFSFDHRPMGLDSLVVTGPDGQPVEPKVIGTGAYRSVFDVTLTKEGTYRLAVASNGANGFYELGGKRERVRGKTIEEARAAIPVGATNVTVGMNVSRTETFVTLGAPSEVKPVGVGLELVPVTHPNDLAAGEPAQFKFLLDGQPAAGIKIEFVEGGTRYRDEAGIQELTTGADGLVTLTAPEAGMYYIEAGSEAGDRRASYTAVLEFLPL
jgi:uncharacterized GH25 family protein